jgi:hypothetical protein
MDEEQTRAFSDRQRAWHQATEAIIDAIPSTYDLLSSRMLTIQHEFNAIIAKRLAAPLSSHLETLPRETDAQRHEIVRWVNEEVQNFGLAICCPVTKQASILHVIPVRPRNPRGGFDIRLKGSGKTTESRANLSDLLPLELMEAPPRREALAEWYGRRVRRQDESRSL